MPDLTTPLALDLQRSVALAAVARRRLAEDLLALDRDLETKGADCELRYLRLMVLLKSEAQPTDEKK